MQLDTVVGEVGTLTVLGLVDDSANSAGLGDELGRALPLGLPTGGYSLLSRLTVLAHRAALELFSDFRRLVVPAPELVLLEALATVSPSLAVVLALPANTSTETKERITANVPPGLDIEDVIAVPTFPAGAVKAADTLIVVAGFAAGPNMWSIPTAARAVMDFYRSQLLYDALLLDPLGLPVYQRTRLFSVVSDVAIDHVLRRQVAFENAEV